MQPVARAILCMTLSVVGGTPAMAETLVTPAFVGQWGSEATCAPEEIVEYSVDAYETMFNFCEIDEISERGAGKWSIAAQCLYEGARNPISIRLQLSGDQLKQTITTADDRAQSSDLVRCAT